MRSTAEIRCDQPSQKSKPERARRAGEPGLYRTSGARCPGLIMHSRIYLHKKRWLLRFTQVLRGWWILGPLRPYAVRYYRRLHNGQSCSEKTSLFSRIDAAQIVATINEQGYAAAGQIPEEYVDEIMNYCENTKLMKYWNPHQDCPAIDRIAP